MTPATPIRPIVAGAKAIVMGSSQSGRFIRSLIHLGFNRDEAGASIVFEGALPHIGGGLMPLNIRFGQPGRATTDTVDHLFPGRRVSVRLWQRDRSPDRAHAGHSRPLHGEQHAVRRSFMRQPRWRCGSCASRSASPIRSGSGISTSRPTSAATSWPRPSMRGAAAAAGQGTVPCLPAAAESKSAQLDHARAAHQPRRLGEGRHRTAAKRRPTIAAGNLVAPDQVRFPRDSGQQLWRRGAAGRAIHRRQRSAARAGLRQAITTLQTHRASSAAIRRSSRRRRYGNLVAQVDADGNDLGGIRNVFVAVPIGTYTGWNLVQQELLRGRILHVAGSFIPFAPTRQERLAIGDPRPSIEERYPTKEAYVAAFRKAADDLVAQRFLLADDAARLISEAERNGIRSAPSGRGPGRGA